ncbi:hypothetical protein [Burkholderia cepacia]|uniref:hypothetical protein n=1 Tax=Burkholderia cepacia TaxID=292 RepID=UPI00298FED56|nr:hypothetical protein [Burkholderia cepacia]
MTQRQAEGLYQSANSCADLGTVAVRFASADLRDYLDCPSSTSAAIVANVTTRIGLRRPVPTHVARIGTHGEEQ